MPTVAFILSVIFSVSKIANDAGHRQVDAREFVICNVATGILCYLFTGCWNLEVYIFLQLSNHESLIIQEYVDECIFASTIGVTTHDQFFFF